MICGTRRKVKEFYAEDTEGTEFTEKRRIFADTEKRRRGGRREEKKYIIANREQKRGRAQGGQ